MPGPPLVFKYLNSQLVVGTATLDVYLRSVGYHKSNADGWIYVKSIKTDGHISFVILGVYM
jgi:hypothetical protein